MANNYEVPIYYQNPAGLSQDEIDQLFRAVQGLYGPIHLNAQPLTSAPASVNEPYYSVSFTNKPIRGKFAEQGGDAIPDARLAYVYPAQWGSYGPLQSQALQFALAHEIGHLLGLQHTLSGIMNPHITTGTLQQNFMALRKAQLHRAEQTLDALRKAQLIQQAKMGR